jgi:hypothetical protein
VETKDWIDSARTTYTSEFPDTPDKSDFRYAIEKHCPSKVKKFNLDEVKGWEEKY